jgi:uncharacterized protein
MTRPAILITGASAGLGAEFARQLAPRAGCLILAARRRDRLDTLTAELAREGLTIHCLCVNLADEADTARFLVELQALGQQIDVLVNNAGLGDHGLFEESEWQRVCGIVNVNIRALLQVTLAVLPPMIARKSGAILNVSSIASLLPLPQMAVYSATKACVTSFSEALRVELRGTGVTVTTLCPGPVNTEFFTVAERVGADPIHSAPEIFKVSAQQVVAEGLRALDEDRPRVIPGWFVLAVMTLTSLVPMCILRIILRKRGRSFTGH